MDYTLWLDADDVLLPSDRQKLLVLKAELDGTADVVIALEPGEAARALPFLAPGGVLVTATTAIQPVTAALSSTPYRAGDVVAALANSLQAEASREQAAEVAIAPNAKANTQDAEAPVWKATRCPCSFP